MHDRRLTVMPCLDSPEMAETCRRLLGISRNRAASLGHSAVEISERGWYVNEQGEKVDISREIQAACDGKISIRPDDPLVFDTAAGRSTHAENAAPGSTAPQSTAPQSTASGNAAAGRETRVQVTNETTLQAARRLKAESGDDGKTIAALNFANGIHPGGGFLQGARAQEEALCRSSALYVTLQGDPMYAYHEKRGLPDSTDWIIYSPGVPVFRTDDGRPLDAPWTLDFFTCAAPYEPAVGADASAELLADRIVRLLQTAESLRCSSLVLGAWGCGAFGNDPEQTAGDFRRILESECAGVFADVVFAVADWSPERRFLGPFCEAFR